MCHPVTRHGHSARSAHEAPPDSPRSKRMGVHCHPRSARRPRSRDGTGGLRHRGAPRRTRTKTACDKGESGGRGTQPSNQPSCQPKTIPTSERPSRRSFSQPEHGQEGQILGEVPPPGDLRIDGAEAVVAHLPRRGRGRRGARTPRTRTELTRGGRNGRKPRNSGGTVNVRRRHEKTDF